MLNRGFVYWESRKVLFICIIILAVPTLQLVQIVTNLIWVGSENDKAIGEVVGEWHGL